ncbi:autotransporter domain-containing protein [Motilimonas eburnea]|uniref:autotransporter domain-containing protein n=1 Tax=Motilimonas eburnea TaxID=1737488 RepID=UPI001E5A3490|nr:autotransporter domain-containing protein [Motilimonas eburnea]MCE2573178.1 autotransporter outer membrane beta-barrel domain-containing protein [Motilimonas eburnea]
MMKFLFGLLLYSLMAVGHAATADLEKLMAKQANAALALMSFSIVPDVTTSTLNIKNKNTEDAALMLTQLGGGATLSESTPIYLEGTLAYSRYDPTFVITRGENTQSVPLKWNSVSVSGGIGWDFPIAQDWVVRPIVNIALGHVVSDLRIAQWYINDKYDLDFSFIDGGRLNAVGFGGSVMLDYELVSPKHDLDLELRYSYIRLESFGSSSRAIEGQANAENLSVYMRRRAPTGYKMLQRPIRYVLEGAHTQFLGEQRGALGFDYMSSTGIGIELDSSAYDVFITRTRLVLRYMFGQNTDGYSLGLAMSF